MKRYLADYAALLSFTGLILAADQWTKWLVRENLAVLESWSPWPWLEPYARIVHWRNTGAAFGMFQDFGEVFKWLAVLVAIGILYFYPRIPRQDGLIRLALILQLAGAVGNLIDRVSLGWVVDFISVGDFAVFNIADASISTGVAVLLIAMWIKERQEKRLEAQDESWPSEAGETSGE